MRAESGQIALAAAGPVARHDPQGLDRPFRALRQVSSGTDFLDRRDLPLRYHCNDLPCHGLQKDGIEPQPRKTDG